MPGAQSTDLGIAVQKIIATSPSPVRASLDFLDKHPADLIVLAVHQYEGGMRWQHKRVAEPIAHANEAMTLYLPQGVPGFVSRENGSISLRNILIPVARKPRAQPAIAAVARMIRALQLPPGKVRLLHVGPGTDVPSLQIPAEPGWDWTVHCLEGEPVEVIVQIAAAAQLRPDRDDHRGTAWLSRCAARQHFGKGAQRMPLPRADSARRAS